MQNDSDNPKNNSEDKVVRKKYRGKRPRSSVFSGIRGVITYYWPSKKYGFVKARISGQEVFFHVPSSRIIAKEGLYVGSKISVFPIDRPNNYKLMLEEARKEYNLQKKRMARNSQIILSVPDEFKFVNKIRRLTPK